MTKYFLHLLHTVNRYKKVKTEKSLGRGNLLTSSKVKSQNANVHLCSCVEKSDVTPIFKPCIILVKGTDVTNIIIKTIIKMRVNEKKLISSCRSATAQTRSTSFRCKQAAKHASAFELNTTWLSARRHMSRAAAISNSFQGHGLTVSFSPSKSGDRLIKAL